MSLALCCSWALPVCAVVVDYVLTLLQFAVIPNVFFSLLAAMLLLQPGQLKRLLYVFATTLLTLWGAVTLLLFSIWYVMLDRSLVLLNAPVFSYENIGVTFVLPYKTLLAIVLGLCMQKSAHLRGFSPAVHRAQEVVYAAYEKAFMLFPILIFFVILNFLSHIGQAQMHWVFSYMMLSVAFLFLLLFSACCPYCIVISYPLI